MRKSKVCVVVPMLLVAVMVTNERLKVVGVPEMVAVPLVLALKVNPLGRVPVSASVAVGEPVVVTVKVKALPIVGAARELLVNFGGAAMGVGKVWGHGAIGIGGGEGEGGGSRSSRRARDGGRTVGVRLEGQTRWQGPGLGQ